MLRRLIAAVAVVASAVAGATTALGQQQQPGPPEPGLGIRLVEAPQDRQDDPRAQRYIIDHVAPGTTFDRRIELSNGTDRVLRVDLYPGPAQLSDGQFVPADSGEESPLTRWITVEPSEATIRPGERIRADVTVAVPPTATRGEYYGVVWAETPGEPPPGGGVAVNSRVGIRVYLSVGPGGEPPTEFELETFTPIRTEDGRPGVEIRACNTGGRAVDLIGSLELSDGPGGTSAGPFSTDQTVTLAPDACSGVPIFLDPELPRGPWNATATLRSGETEKSAEAEITFPDEAGEQGRKVEAKEVTGTAGGRIALAIALLLLLIALGLLLFSFLRRRRRDEEEERVPARA